MHQYVVLAAVLFAVGLYGQLTRVTGFSSSVSLLLVYIGSSLAVVSFGRFIHTDGIVAQAFAILLLLIGGLNTFITHWVGLGKSQSQTSRTVPDVKRFLLSVVTCGVLIGTFKLETDPSQGRGFPFLTVIIGTGMTVLYLSALRAERDNNTAAQPDFGGRPAPTEQKADSRAS